MSDSKPVSAAFIPPDGAMQFELKAEFVAIGGINVHWVKGPKVSVPPCRRSGCKLCWEVLDATQEELDHATKILGNIGLIPTVCACIGRIIE